MMVLTNKVLILVLLLIHLGICLRGVWFSVSGSIAAYSYEGIVKVVAKCRQTNVDVIYFSVWDQSMVNFKLSEKFQQKYPFVHLNRNFQFDPLRILIKEAHAQNISVIAWFQYGFAVSYGDETGGPILHSKPQWISLNSSGQLTTKNNFQWINGFHSEVQNFIIEMMQSLLEVYVDIDGIQGDDRLPAMPSPAGYDSYTKQLFKKQFGKEPPLDIYQENWIQWRCNILNKFCERIWEQFSFKNGRKYAIHMAPSVYPWSKNQYLQDWPTWVNSGWVDQIIPQIYRYNIQAYSQTLQQNLQNIDSTKSSRFMSGVLIGVGSNSTVNIDILQESLRLNKDLEIGQSLFYHESLFDSRVTEILKKQNELIKQFS